jgi:outer membrane protein assembly factor BamB
MVRRLVLPAAGLFLAAAPGFAQAPIAGCEVTKPKGDYAQATLTFDLPAPWTYVGGMRDGRMAVDHGAGVREPGGHLDLKNGKLTGSFTHVRRTNKASETLRVALDAVVRDGRVTGTAKVNDRDVTVTGRVESEAELAKRNAVPADKGWPSFLGPVGGGAAATPTGVKLVDAVRDLRPVWRAEEPMPQGLAPLTRFMHTWKDASAIRTGGGRVFAAYFVPAPGGKDDPAKLEALAAEAKAAGVDAVPWFAREKLYAAADEVVVCLHAATGKTLWKAVVRGRGASNQHHKTGPFNLSPAAGEGRVFALGTSGNLYAFDAATGKPLWEAVYQPAGARGFFADNVASSYTPVVFPGVVVAPDARRWAGYDAATGKRLWTDKRYAKHCTVSRWSGGGKDYVLAVVGELGKPAEELVCLDPQTGRQLWAEPVAVASAGRGLGPGGLSVAGDTLLGYVRASAEKTAPAEEAKVAAFCVAWKLGPAGPKEVWRVPVVLATPEHVPVLVAGKFVFTGDLQVIDLGSGKVTGKAEGMRPENGGYLMAAEDTVLVRRDGTHGKIEMAAYRVDAGGRPTPLDGGAAWVPAVGGSTTSYHHPVMYPLVDGRLFVRQYDGVYCYDLRRGG